MSPLEPPPATPGPKISDVHALPQGVHTLRVERDGVGFWAHVWKGGPGPVLLVNGATHGDEYEGPELLRRWTHTWRPSRLCGTLIAVPVLNEGAFTAGRRVNPEDGMDLARAFPGNAGGGPTARVALLFDKILLSQCTHYVDVHSAGAAYELLPWVGFLECGGSVGVTQREMAACFGGFWCWAGPYLPGRTLSAAHARNIPAIYIECSGAGTVRGSEVRRLESGLKRLMRGIGLIPGGPSRGSSQRFYASVDRAEAHLQVHHPAPIAGIFVPVRPGFTLGAAVKRGDLLGAVYPVGPGECLPLVAERSGRIVFLRRQRSVQAGDAICVVVPV